MKKLLILALFFAAAYGAHAQVPISKMPTFTGDPTGSYVPIIVNGVNRKIDARYFGYTQASYVQRKIGTDSLFWVSGDGVYHFISRMDTSGVIKTGRSYIDSSLAQMLAHDTAQIGDISIRSDSSISYVLHSLPSSASANWYQLKFPASVISFNGRTGNINPITGDYNHSQVSGVDSLLGLRSAYVASITTLENYTGNSNTVIVQDSLRGGTFNYVASATPDSGTVFNRYGGGYWQRNYKGAMNSQWFGGINAAITGIGAKNALLHISQAETLAANTTIPANVDVEILKGGSINVPSGDTLTINGTFKAGRYQVFSGSGLINFGSSSIDAQFPEWDGAKADGSNYCTAMFAKEYARNVPISLGVGSYLVDSITTGNLNYPLVIKGQGMKVSKITVAYGNVNGIWIGEQQTVANSVLKDFLISGHVGNKGGIALGNGTVTYNVGVAANTLIENVEVYNFSDTGQFGIELNEVQELNVHNCYLYQNWNNYWRPNYGFVTSTLIDGKAGYDGGAYNRGADLEGVVNDITFRNQVFENNQNEAIYYNRIDGSPIITVQGCYFESNNKSFAANGIVSISGNQTVRLRPVAIIRNNVFYDPSDTTHNKIWLDNTHNSVVADNSGNMYPMQVTAGTNCYFNNNASFITGFGSAPMKNMYNKMYAVSNKITVDDWDTLGAPFHIGTLTLNSKAYYNSNPTFTSADSNSVINKRYADSLAATVATFTGSNGYIQKQTSTRTMGNSVIYDDGTNAAIGTTTMHTKFTLAGASNVSHLIWQTNALSSSLQSQFQLVNGTTWFGTNDRSYQFINNGINSTSAELKIDYWDGSTYNHRLNISPLGISTFYNKLTYSFNPTMTAADSLALYNKKAVDSIAALKASTSTTINTHSLSANVTITYPDIPAGATANGTTATTQATTDSSGKLETTARVKQLLASLNVDLYADKGVAIDTTLHPGHITFVIDSAYVVDSVTPYKVYMATVNNASGTVLTPTVLRNTLGGAITWTHTGTGDWTGTLTGAFTSGKTIEIIGSNQTKAVGQREYLIWFDVNTVHFQVTDASGASIDGNISNEPIEIRVYK